MVSGKKILMWMGSQTVKGLKAGGQAINKEIKKGLEERNQKNAIYRTEFEKAKKHEEIRALRKKAQRDAKRSIKEDE
jgi:hypothetical protein